MTDPLYKAIWSPEVSAQLSSGAARIMQDKSGLLLPSAHDGSKIIGLPRLVEASAGQAANVGVLNVLNPILGIANVFATGFNIWQVGKLRKETKAEFEFTREVLLAGLAQEASLTRTVVALDGHATRELVGAGFSQLSEQLALATTYNVQILARVQETNVRGFLAVLDSIQDLRKDAASGFERVESAIREEIKLLSALDLRKEIYALTAAQEVIHSASDFEAGEIRAKTELLHGSVIPGLRAHFDGPASPEQRVPLLLLLMDAYRTLGTSWALTGKQSQGATAFRKGRLAGTEMIQVLLDGGTPFEFFTTRLPAAQLLVGAVHSLRVSELAVAPQSAELIPLQEARDHGANTEVVVLDRGAGPTRLPRDLGAGDGQRLTLDKWGRERSASFVERILKERPAKSRRVTVKELAVAAELPSDMLPGDGVTQTVVDELSKVLVTIADPAHRQVDSLIVQEAVGLRSVCAQELDEFRSDAALELSAELGISISSPEVSGIGHRNLRLLASRNRLRNDDEDDD